MRTRLLLVLAVLGAVVVTAFAVPLAASMAEARTREFVLSRDADLQRFADLADGYARNGSPGLLLEEVGAYHGLYGEAVAVVSTRGAAPQSVGTSLDDPAVSAAIGRALRNERSSGVELLTPWSPGTVVFAKPIGTGAQVNGAVVIVASTESTRNDILQGWAVIGVGFLAAVIGFGILAMSVSRWVLRPLEEVSTRMQLLTKSLPFLATGSGTPGTASAAGRTGPPELRALSAAFETMDNAVHTSADAQRRLVADTAHQLRNPLAALQLRLDTLGPRVMDDGKKSYQRAMGEAIRLEEILDDLLALSVAEAPRTKGVGEDTCIPQLVAVERADFWHDTAVGAGIEFDVQDDPAELEATISTGDLEQILDILFDNICKYAGPGTTAQISTGRGGSPEAGWRTVVTVSDDGAGVTHGELELVTRRFYRGSPPGEPSRDGGRPTGTGLGLSIVEALVESNGGELLIRDTPGGGLTVQLSFATPADGEAGR
ncbi:HAMP domain-containing sensor histidine kinase [Burkholderia sp. RS01]|uniref:sensor histidine kinase n=1 Tax=unclassified Burkholderia TaxID=2613784 RepID=UPI0032184DD3